MSFLAARAISSGGLTGHTRPATEVPSDVAGLRRNLIGQLGQIDPLTGVGGDLTPFTSLFQQQLAPVLAQAKESAGNLTGSGLQNILGATAGRSTSDFLLNLLAQRAQRAAALTAQLIRPQDLAYTPGFLDYLFAAFGKAAPGISALRPQGLNINIAGGGPGAGAGGDAGIFGVDSAIPVGGFA